MVVKTWKVSAGIIITSVLIVTQYILAFFVYKLPGLKELQILGWEFFGLFKQNRRG